MRLAHNVLLAVLALPALAAQFAKFGDTEIHYVVVNTMFLTEEVAAQNGIERSPNRAFVNLSVLKADVPARADVTGTVTNLLGQARKLTFREVTEAASVYYLASLEHDDGDTLRFAVDVTIAGDATHRVEFQEMLYQEPQ